MSRNSSTGAPSVKGVESASTRPIPKDASYLAHQAEQLLAQLEILHVFAMQNPEACKPAVTGAIGAAFDTASNLSHELDVLEAAE